MAEDEQMKSLSMPRIGRAPATSFRMADKHQLIKHALIRSTHTTKRSLTQQQAIQALAQSLARQAAQSLAMTARRMLVPRAYATRPPTQTPCKN